MSGPVKCHFVVSKLSMMSMFAGLPSLAASSPWPLLPAPPRVGQSKSRHKLLRSLRHQLERLTSAVVQSLDELRITDRLNRPCQGR